MSQKLKIIVAIAVLTLIAISLLNNQLQIKPESLKFTIKRSGCDCTVSRESIEPHPSINQTEYSLDQSSDHYSSKNWSLNSLGDKNSVGVNYKETMCSLDAFKRGSGQNVVAFSFYEPKNMSDSSKRKRYFDGEAGLPL